MKRLITAMAAVYFQQAAIEHVSFCRTVRRGTTPVLSLGHNKSRYYISLLQTIL